MRAGRLERRDLPHEDGAWVEFQTISGRQIDEAQEVKTKRTMRLVEGLDISTLRAAADTAKAEERDSYDADTLIKYAIVNCSECDQCTEESKQALDAATRNWAVDVILEMNVRPLASASGSGSNSSMGNFRLNSPSLTASTSSE
jgi:hypothetical protein